jgi:replication factor C small subunit
MENKTTMSSIYQKIWCEKYRPSTIDELIVDGDIKSIIKDFSKAEQIPNLLFVGSPGTGKTSLAKILVHDVLKCNYLYLNASDENGIDTIRTKVSNFSQTKSFDGKVKVVILDEADGITAQGQQALRNLMESYSGYTRFILTANFKHKIITPLQSRCQSLNLKPSLEQAVKRCYFILKQENVDLEEDQKKKFVELIKNYFPDLRKTINELQKSVVDGKLVIKCTTIDNEFIKKVFDFIKTKKVLDGRKYIIQNEDIFQNDYQSLLKQMLEHVYAVEGVDELKKKQMIAIIAEHIYRSVFVIDSEVNFFACVIQLELNYC